MNLIIDSIFFSFPIFIIITSPFYLAKDEKIKALHYSFRNAAIITLSIAGLAYTIELIYLEFSPPSNDDFEYVGLVALSRAVGPYWHFFILTILTYTIFPLLIWIKKIRDSRIFISALILSTIITSNFERIIIIITSMHRDNVLSPWSYIPLKIMISSWLIQIGIFIGIASATFFIRKKLKSSIK